MAEIWDPLFPDYPLAADPDLQAIVLKLGDDKITAWRNKFSTTELEALEEVFGHEGAETAQARADSVACLLEGEDKNLAFYYREYADEDGNVIKKGLFQGHLIVRGLAAHYASIRSPRAPVENPATADFPETALVHTIQAAKRALHYTETGKLVIPGHRLGEFSRANWGDRMVFQEGRSVAVNSTSGLVKIVRKLRNNPDLSKRIMQAAIEASLPKRRSAAVVEVIDIDLDATETSDFELEDNEWYVVPQPISGPYLRDNCILVAQIHCAARVCRLNTLLQ
ncbi:hypothetical protein DFH08DRAFT_882420 [Mycena albidolilacea]|uniref:Uncharacterized protein n=1 Tax=Mycena albidolilacea TaxID=1033008 RepID=A0AAD6ZML4_9AGAR|nr:hypothetical protein DFH08DRAFT_882420 [Mycena albidolilacea]